MLHPLSKTIVCLANSRKPPEGRCVAGREVTDWGFGGWIRPVSARPTHELTMAERGYCDGVEPRVLDLIHLELQAPQPHLHQQENWVITQRHWERRGRIGWKALQEIVEVLAGPLWLNGYSSHLGQNDRVPEALLSPLMRSLCLVHVEQLTLSIADEGIELGSERRRVRAHFNLCGHPYCLVVTDPVIEEYCFHRTETKYTIGEAALCLSLGEVFHGFAYKLVATLITPRRAGS